MKSLRYLLVVFAFILFGMGFYYGNPGEGHTDKYAAGFAFGASGVIFILALFLEPIVASLNEGPQPKNGKALRATRRRLSPEDTAEFSRISEQNWKSEQSKNS